MSQFFYKTQRPTGVKVEGVDQTEEIEISFNVDRILVTITQPDGVMKVVLDDWHEEKIPVTQPGKNGKGTTTVMKSYTGTTDFLLKPEDAERLRSISSSKDYKLVPLKDKEDIEKEFDK